MNEKTFKDLEFYKFLELVKLHAKTTLAKHKFDLLKPEYNIEIINQLQDEVEQAQNIISKKGKPPFSEIDDLTEFCSILEKGGYLDIKSLYKILMFLKISADVKKFILNDEIQKKSLETGLNLIEKIADDINFCTPIYNDLDRILLSEENLSDNASTNLYKIRKSLKLKEKEISEKLNNILQSQTYDSIIQDKIITIRDGRYVIPIKSEGKNIFKGIVHGQSSSGSTFFMEPIALVNINNELKLLEIEEEKEIFRILKEVSMKIYRYLNILTLNQKLIIELDFIFAKASYSLENNCVKPVMNDKKYFQFISVRHPLIDKDKVVPIDIHMSDEIDTIIVTGPNTGGKTVALKTVGLNILMAQCGFHILSEIGSEICVFKNIFTDIGDEQSIKQSLSTFSSHMKNLIYIMENIDDNSLVLLDEIGSGTDPAEGSALAISILEYLQSKKSKTIATTHYSELKFYGTDTKGVLNASVEFDLNTLSPTYKLILGNPGKSNAIEISKRLGLKDDIINRAKTLINKEYLNFESIVEEIEKKRIESERLNRELLTAQEKSQKIEKLLKEKEDKINDEREKIIQAAKKEAEELIEKTKKYVEDLRKEASGIKTNYKLDEKRRMTEIKNELSNMKSKFYKDEKKTSINKNEIKLGSHIKLKNSEDIAIVLTLPDKKGNLQIEMGILKMNINVDDIRDIVEQDFEQSKKSNTSYYKNKDVKNIVTEIDIRGKNVEEGIYEVDKFLDNAFLSKVKTVSIIHGKGTGLLKKGIVDFLNKNPHVKKIEDAAFNQGGAGVTVVELK